MGKKRAKKGGLRIEYGGDRGRLRVRLPNWGDIQSSCQPVVRGPQPRANPGQQGPTTGAHQRRPISTEPPFSPGLKTRVRLCTSVKVIRHFARTLDRKGKAYTAWRNLQCSALSLTVAV